MTPLKDKVAVITGAASGIGLATAKSLAGRGAKVVLADIDGERAKTHAAAIGSSALAVRCDITAETAFEDVKAAAQGHFGAVDIVMNNAGAITRGAPEDMPFAEWRRIIDLNLMTVVRSIGVFLPDMLARGSGHIVNTASAAGLFPYAYDRLPYASSKAAVVILSEGLSLYCKPKGVGVTVLCPGPVRTNIAAGLKSFTEGLATRGPGPGFTLLEADEVGEMVANAIEADQVFLPTHELIFERMQEFASDPNAFITGLIAEMAEG